MPERRIFSTASKNAQHRSVLFGAAVGHFVWLQLVVGAERRVPSEKRIAIEKAVSSFMAANSVPGISVAVVQNGKLIWSEGFGMADLENFVPAWLATLYRLGSTSKTITATAILQLSERGKLVTRRSHQALPPAARSLLP